jgi:hypothetical protein
MQIHEWRRDAEAERERDKPRQGVVANTLKLSRNRAVGFIDWLGRRPVPSRDERNAQKQPTRNTAAKKPARQEDMDSGYLFANFSQGSLQPPAS